MPIYVNERGQLSRERGFVQRGDILVYDAELIQEKEDKLKIKPGPKELLFKKYPDGTWRFG